MGKYLLENIHVQFPSARLGIVVGSRASMLRDLFAAYPWLEIIEANHRSPSALFSLLKNFYGSDLVITQYAGKPGGAFFIWKQAFRPNAYKKDGLIGFHDASRWNRMLYDQLLLVRPEGAVAEHDRAALRVAGVPVSLSFPTLRYVEDRGALSKFNLETGKFIVAHLFSGSTARGLHPDKNANCWLRSLKNFPTLVW